MSALIDRELIQRAEAAGVTLRMVLDRAALYLKKQGWIGRTPRCPTCGQTPMDAPRRQGVHFIRAIYFAIQDLRTYRGMADETCRLMGFANGVEAQRWSEEEGRTFDELMTRLEGKDSGRCAAVEATRTDPS